VDVRYSTDSGAARAFGTDEPRRHYLVEDLVYIGRRSKSVIFAGVDPGDPALR
jgi:5-keto 4-deoxyuronate isomerase